MLLNKVCTCRQSVRSHRTRACARLLVSDVVVALHKVRVATSGSRCPPGGSRRPRGPPPPSRWRRARSPPPAGCGGVPLPSRSAPRGSGGRGSCRWREVDGASEAPWVATGYSLFWDLSRGEIGTLFKVSQNKCIQTKSPKRRRTPVAEARVFLESAIERSPGGRLILRSCEVRLSAPSLPATRSSMYLPYTPV